MKTRTRKRLRETRTDGGTAPLVQIVTETSSVRVIVIGESPGPNTRAALPLFPYPTNSAGYRLAHMTGLTRAGYLEFFYRLNLIPSYQGPKWSAGAARDAADNLSGGGILGGYHVLLMGAKVWRAFGGHKSEFSYCRWYKRYGRHWSPSFHVAVIPHPSGRNRLYNDGHVKYQVVRFLHDLAEGRATQRYAFCLPPGTSPHPRRRLRA